jgi:hypothetical protein
MVVLFPLAFVDDFDPRLVVAGVFIAPLKGIVHSVFVGGAAELLLIALVYA